MHRPLLRLDVDGVLNPYGGPCPDGYDLFPDGDELAVDPATGLTRAVVERALAWAVG